MNLNPTVPQLIKMMVYLNEQSFVIPSYNMQMPKEADGVNFRSQKVFRILRSGLMNYYGSGEQSAGKADIHIGGIKPTQNWIDRAYIFLLKRVQENIKKKTERSKMEHIAELLLRFNGLDFVDMTDPFEP